MASASAAPPPTLEEIEAVAADGDFSFTPGEAAPAVKRPLPSVRDAVLARKPLDYASPAHRDPLEKQLAAQSRIKDLYVPLVLIVAGVILLFVDAAMGGIRNPILACLYVLGISLLNMLLIAVAMLAAVKLVDVGLGTLGPAVLKLLAVALFPGAIAGIIGHSTGGVLYWGVSLVLYYCMMSYLFEMDGGEIRVAVLMIWGLRFVAQLVIIVVISKLGSHAAAQNTPSIPAPAYTTRPLAPIVRTPANGGFTYVPPPLAAPTPPPETEQQAADTIDDGDVFEAVEWFQDGPIEHTGLTLSRADMRHLAEKFYAGGARKVWVANPVKAGRKEVCSEFIIEMPDEPVHRKLIMKVKNSLEPHTTPTRDTGMRLLDVGIK